MVPTLCTRLFACLTALAVMALPPAQDPAKDPAKETKESKEAKEAAELDLVVDDQHFGLGWVGRHSWGTVACGK